MTNPLVAPPEAPSGTAGTGLLGDVVSIAGDSSPVDFALDGVALGLDALSMALDPFGAIASAGVGWLLNHVEFLREPLDHLTGDAAQIQAASQTWINVATEVSKAAAQYQTSLNGIGAWSGVAADDYRTAATDYISLLDAIVTHCESTSKGIEIAGIVVGTERGLVYDALSSFIGRCVVEAIAALASSWFTFGASIGAFIAVVDVDASIQAEQFAMRIGALMKKVGQLGHRLDSISQNADHLATAIERAGGRVRMRAGGSKGLKTIQKNRFLRAHPTGPIAKINQLENTLKHSPLNNVHDVVDDHPNLTGRALAAAKEAREAQQSHDSAGG